MTRPATPARQFPAPHPRVLAPPLSLPATPQAAGRARSHTRAVLADQLPGACAGAVEDVILIVSELVTNAVRYGTEPGDAVQLGLLAAPGGVRIEVRDPCRRHPKPRRRSDQRSRGRGLYIVEGLARSWGVVDSPFGKTVWAETVWPSGEPEAGPPGAGPICGLPNASTPASTGSRRGGW
ncbi:ATP-binding protein [Streptomyces sp. C10-9-1]|uniref:ATP-binding protein n=1 Tax=Streptomyces sp. C10-9-1 TaxID=1859285 RepID=UPI003D74CE8C